MLLSLEKNFIFIHIPKTAGSSVGRALQPWCVRPRKSQWRRLLSHLPVPEAAEKAVLRQHDTAAWVRLKLPADLYERAYKFAVVRNPFDLAVSNFHHLRRSTTRHHRREAQHWDLKAFLRYLEGKDGIRRVDQTNWITDRAGRVIIDEVLRYEALDEQFEALVRRLGLPAGLKLARVNVTVHDDYRSYYDDEARAIVQRLYARDIERFGYAF